MTHPMVMKRGFEWMIRAEADQIRAYATALIQPQPDYAAGGSSFAVTVRPRWTLWLSQASLERLRDTFGDDALRPLAERTSDSF